jgi:hypothetical protein
MGTAPQRPYPDSDLNVGGPNERTVELFAAAGCRRYAEIGVYRGYTAERIARVLGGGGEIHLFDYADRVEPVAARLRAAGHRNVVAHGNSRRLLDSYNWSLMAVLAEQPEPVLDYVFIDGAHAWAHDALAFLLADRLLVRGGYIDFDDDGRTPASSPSMNPAAVPRSRRSTPTSRSRRPRWRSWSTCSCGATSATSRSWPTRRSASDDRAAGERVHRRPTPGCTRMTARASSLARDVDGGEGRQSRDVPRRRRARVRSVGECFV